MTTSAYDEIIPDAQGYPGYDKNGNIMGLSRYSSTGSISDNFTYNYTQNKNRLTSISGTSAIQYKYDGNGNVTADPGKNIALIIYDTDNLPVTVYKTDGSQIQYYYDVNGNRVRKSTVGESSTYYINGYDGKTEVVSHVPTGSDFTYNIWGNDLIGQIRIVGTTATRYYYLKDHLGNIRMTVNSAGNPVSWDDYYPFGSVMNGRSQISSADNRYKFTGKERDTETNYDYFGARYYDARIGRWLQVDPWDNKYPEWSSYNYSLNNPLKFIDGNGKGPGDIQETSYKFSINCMKKISDWFSGISNVNNAYIPYRGEDVNIVQGVKEQFQQGLKEDVAPILDKVSQISETTALVASGAQIATVWAPPVSATMGTIAAAAGGVSFTTNVGSKLIRGESLTSSFVNAGTMVASGILTKGMMKLSLKDQQLLQNTFAPVSDFVSYGLTKLVEEEEDQDNGE